MGIDITKLLEIIKDPDLKIKINDLYGENLTLKRENFDLKDKIKKLNEELDITSSLITEGNHYYLMMKDKKDGPFCTKCWDVDRKLVRIHDGGSSNGVQYFSCPNCKTNTKIGEYIQPPTGGMGWQ